MPQQTKLDVSKWQAARPAWAYTPVLWFFYRMIEVAYIDAKTAPRGNPTDDALLARDWIARSEPGSNEAYLRGARREYVSFPECCAMLGLNADAERVGLLDAIDGVVDSDTEEAWTRLEDLTARELVDDVEPLFDAPRIVPVLDQMALF